MIYRNICSNAIWTRQTDGLPPSYRPVCKMDFDYLRKGAGDIGFLALTDKCYTSLDCQERPFTLCA